MKIAIQTADFDVSVELAALRAAHRDNGAVVSFVGTVREISAGVKVRQMELEHYPGMTEKSLGHVVQRALKRWDIDDVIVIHRVGALPVGAQIVLVAVTSKHRGTAFLACEFILDYLKTEAPFWKKEVAEDCDHWVRARDSDLSALDKWSCYECK